MDIETLLNSTVNSVKSIYKKNLITSKTKKKDAIWWDDKLGIEGRRIRALRRRYQTKNGFEQKG